MAASKCKVRLKPTFTYDFSAEVAVELKRLVRTYPYPMHGALDDLRAELLLLARDIRLVRKGDRP